MALEFRKASRSRAKLKIGFAAPSGGGKTIGSLIAAFGLLKKAYPNLPDEDIWGKIAIIDTENKSAELYENHIVKSTGFHIGTFNVVSLEPPFTAHKYIEAINLCENNSVEACIIDSITHLWTGDGGLLDKQGKAAGRTGNSYTAWREVTPDHNRFVDTMLQSEMHIFATVRSKTEYAQQKSDKGKTEVVKLGMAPQFRDGIEYEFTVFFEIGIDHTAKATKDRTGIFDGDYFTISQKTGEMLYDWAINGKPIEKKEQELKLDKADSSSVDEAAVNATRLSKAKEEIKALIDSLLESGVDKKIIANTIKEKHTVNGKASPNFDKIIELDVAISVFKSLKALAK